MYEGFFNLKAKPFELTPNPDFLYLSNTHKKARTHFDYGVREKTGFILLTGEVGTGKTTLVRNFIKKLDNTITLCKVFNTRVNSEQLITMINEDFGLQTGGKDKMRLLKELYAFLIEEYTKGNHCVLIIDEAQNLTPELLEEVRLLSNLETDDAKLLQIILVGQPELAQKLSLEGLRQLRQRISIVCQLYPLTRSECEEYIFSRLEKAGNRDAVKFTPEALDLIYSHSKGTPRVVNILCNFLMLTAFTEEKRDIDAGMVNDVVQGLKIETPSEAATDPAAGKKALLSALGAPQDGAAGYSPLPPHSDQRRTVDELTFAVKDISLRMAAMEKEYSRLSTEDRPDMGKRLEMVEKLLADHERKQVSQFSERQSKVKEYETGYISRDSNNGSNREHAKPGLLKRFFGTG